MVRRYYCDYCDRTLPYSVEARKKHNFGHQHRAAKRAYYESLKTAGERYNEELQKNKCKRFFSGQCCAYGETCIYSHLTETGLETLRKDAEEQNEKLLLPSQACSGYEPYVAQIKATLEKNSSTSLKWTEEMIQSYSKPNPNFKYYHPLPPSLELLKFEGIWEVKYNTWG